MSDRPGSLVGDAMGVRRSSRDCLSAGFQSEKTTGESHGTKPGADVTEFADHDESGLVDLATKRILAVKSTVLAVGRAGLGPGSGDGFHRLPPCGFKVGYLPDKLGESTPIGGANFWGVDRGLGRR